MITNKRITLINALTLIGKRDDFNLETKSLMSLQYLGLVGSFDIGGKIPLFKMFDSKSSNNIRVMGFTGKGVIFEYSKIDQTSKINSGSVTIAYSDVLDFLINFFIDIPYDGFRISFVDVFEVDETRLISFRFASTNFMSFVKSAKDSYGTLLCLWLSSMCVSRYGNVFSKIGGTIEGLNYDGGNVKIYYVISGEPIAIFINDFLYYVFNGLTSLSFGDKNKINLPYEMSELLKDFQVHIGEGFDKLFDLVVQCPDESVEEELVIGGELRRELDKIPKSKGEIYDRVLNEITKSIDISRAAEGVADLPGDEIEEILSLKPSFDKGGKYILPGEESRDFIKRPHIVIPDDKVRNFEVDHREELIKYFIARGMLDKLVKNSGIYVSVKSNVLIGPYALLECGVELINQSLFRFLHMREGKLVSNEFGIDELYDYLVSGDLSIHKIPNLPGQKIYIVDVD